MSALSLGVSNGAAPGVGTVSWWHTPALLFVAVHMLQDPESFAEENCRYSTHCPAVGTGSVSSMQEEQQLSSADAWGGGDVRGDIVLVPPSKHET